MNTGTRTQVACTAMSGSRIFFVSTDHLPLFLGRAVIHELVDMRDAVEGDFLGELLRRALFVHEGRLGVVEQLVHAFLAGARHRLVGRDDHALDLELVVQRLQRHHHLDGRAVRVGDDAALAEAGAVPAGSPPAPPAARPASMRKWLVLSITMQPCGRGARRMDGGDRRAGAEQADIPAGEIERLQVLDLQHAFSRRRRPPTPAERPEARAATSDDREIPLRQGFQHLASDRPGGADNRDPVAHLCKLLKNDDPGPANLALPNERHDTHTGGAQG